jgi:hypothetical protein
MTKKRNRKRPLLSLQERLAKFAEDARAAAKELPAGAERHELLAKARDGETAAKMDRWLSSPCQEGSKSIGVSSRNSG